MHPAQDAGNADNSEEHDVGDDLSLYDDDDDEGTAARDSLEPYLETVKCGLAKCVLWLVADDVTDEDAESGDWGDRDSMEYQRSV